MASIVRTQVTRTPDGRQGGREQGWISVGLIPSLRHKKHAQMVESGVQDGASNCCRTVVCKRLSKILRKVSEIALVGLEALGLLG